MHLSRAYYEQMSDPRVQRTRLHVLNTAREMLGERSGEPLTLTSLATRAQVSRRTLYTHWGTIERVISDAVTLYETSDGLSPEGLSPRERLEIFLATLRERLHDPVTNAALATLIHEAAQDDSASEPLAALGAWPIQRFEASVAPVTEDQYLQIVGPLFLAEFVMREPASDALLAALVERGVELLQLDQLASIPAVELVV
jgi:AcrR family transcriptional regulator